MITCSTCGTDLPEVTDEVIERFDTTVGTLANAGATLRAFCDDCLEKTWDDDAPECEKCDRQFRHTPPSVKEGKTFYAVCKDCVTNEDYDRRALTVVGTPR